MRLRAALGRIKARSDTAVTFADRRWTTRVHKVYPHHPDPEKWDGIMEDWHKTGFGFRDYGAGQSHDFIEGSYGVSVVRPRTLVGLVEDIPDTRLFMYQERRWGANHDVLAFGKPKWDQGATW